MSAAVTGLLCVGTASVEMGTVWEEVAEADAMGDFRARQVNICCQFCMGWVFLAVRDYTVMSYYCSLKVVSTD